MAFDKYLAYRSQGVNPSMYSNDRKEALKMMDEDMYARWGQDASGFQKAMLDQRMRERQGGMGNAAPEDQPKEEKQQPAAQPAQQAHAPAAAGNQWQHPLAAAHFGAQSKMIAATNAAWANEMDSRREQSAAEASRQHEYEMEMLKQQGRQQAEQQQDQQVQQASQLDQIRKARNRSLLNSAGLGGHTIKSGPGGTKVTPHQFGNSPFASALLGD